MNKVLDEIMNRLLRSGFANDENAEIVRFGLELLIMKTVVFSAMIAVAIAMNSLPAALVFIAAYAALRNNCGGYHSRSRITCFFTSLSILAAALSAVRFIQGKAAVFVSAAFLITGTFLIITLAPVDTPTKPFDSTERIVFRRRSLITAFVVLLLSVSLALLGLHQLALSASCAVLMTGIMLAAGRITNKKGVVT